MHKTFIIILYVILINAAVITASIILHELGHLTVGTALGCDGEISLAGLLNPVTPGPYTSLSCPVLGGQGIAGIPTISAMSAISAMPAMAAFLGLSGFLFLVPLALVFLLLAKRLPEKNLAFVVLGFSLALASLDLMLVFYSNIIMYLSLAAGVIVMVMGELFLVDDYLSYAMHREKARHMAKRVIHRKNKPRAARD